MPAFYIYDIQNNWNQSRACSKCPGGGGRKCSAKIIILLETGVQISFPFSYAWVWLNYNTDHSNWAIYRSQDEWNENNIDSKQTRKFMENQLKVFAGDYANRIHVQGSFSFYVMLSVIQRRQQRRNTKVNEYRCIRVIAADTVKLICSNRTFSSISVNALVEMVFMSIIFWKWHYSSHCHKLFDGCQKLQSGVSAKKVTLVNIKKMLKASLKIRILVPIEQKKLSECVHSRFGIRVWQLVTETGTMLCPACVWLPMIQCSYLRFPVFLCDWVASLSHNEFQYNSNC